ncbi:hypothetical protein OUZ56_008764 [Daphnia magna]|uniref:Uncharacterized protein n=1 Tax=Daphnia magna TaxID=35525 RepID=A0ABR0ADY3_9CRUS|nr:hypothetical protein OUZ56_008764 [Daphnia magna]
MKKNKGSKVTRWINGTGRPKIGPLIEVRLDQYKLGGRPNFNILWTSHSDVL